MRQRLIFLILSFGLFCSYSLLGQRFQGGLIAGFNLTQLDGDRIAGYNKIGLNVGGKVTTVLTDKWGFTLELLFSQQGSRASAAEISPVYDAIRLNFVEVPVFLHFQDWKFKVNAGLTYNRLIDYEVIQIDGADITDAQDYRVNNVGLVLGITYVSGEHWSYDGRWTYFLNDLQANSGSSAFISKGISFRVIYTF